MRGIDVSNYQGNINFRQVKDSGIDFVIIRAGWGVTPKQVDPMFHRYIRDAVDAGLHIGAYWFLYALNTHDAVLNANAFVQLLSSYKGSFDFPVCADFEYDSERYMRVCGVQPTKELNTAIVKAFCETVEKGGYYVSNYANPDFLNNHFHDKVLSRFDLWLALWGSEKDRECGIWQYTSSGTVPGITGRVDMDVSLKDYPSIIRKAGLNFVNSSQDDFSHVDEQTDPETPSKGETISYYTIVKGDTLSEIAQRHGTSYIKLAKENGISNPNLIYPGQTIRIV